MGGTAFIGTDDTWALWAIIAACAALAIYLEQKYVWAGKVTGCVLASAFTMVLSNLGIIPTESGVYDNVWKYIVPLSVPLLLFNADIKKMWKESGRAFVMYLLSSLGTILGGFVAYFIFKNIIPELNKVVPMFVGTYTGGSVNFIFLAQHYAVSGKTVLAALVADNFIMFLYLFILISIPSLSIIKKLYKRPYEEAVMQAAEEGQENKTLTSKFWETKEISLKDLAIAVAVAFIVATLSTKISDHINSIFPGSGVISKFISGFLGNKYLLMTFLIVMLASAFPNRMAKVKGAQAIGTFFIYIFFAVIGAPASIIAIIKESPLLLVVAFIIVAVNMAVSLLAGKIFNFSIEEIVIASNANIGGPTTATAMAVSKGWEELIIPGILTGTLGYVLGSYLGIFSGMFLH